MIGDAGGEVLRFWGLFLGPWGAYFYVLKVWGLCLGPWVRLCGLFLGPWGANFCVYERGIMADAEVI